jgi:lipoyl synthase
MSSSPEPVTKPRPAPIVQGEKLRGAEKMARIPIKIEPTLTPLRKPSWIRAKSQATPEVARIKAALRANNLHTVCEEASCPNLGECFGHGTATFMIMGDICTRRCPFCNVAHGRPNALDANEPVNLARTIRDMGLRYVVVTSVDRDDCPMAARRISPLASANRARFRRRSPSKCSCPISAAAGIRR